MPEKMPLKIICLIGLKHRMKPDANTVMNK